MAELLGHLSCPAVAPFQPPGRGWGWGVSPLRWPKVSDGRCENVSETEEHVRVPFGKGGAPRSIWHHKTTRGDTHAVRSVLVSDPLHGGVFWWMRAAGTGERPELPTNSLFGRPYHIVDYLLLAGLV